jgi:hypothetical protein
VLPKRKCNSTGVEQISKEMTKGKRIERTRQRESIKIKVTSPKGGKKPIL